jgi:ATP-dependent Clp protease ATP-binding subunit ClpA
MSDTRSRSTNTRGKADQMKRRNRAYDLRFTRAVFTAAEALAAGEREPGAEHLVIACLDFQEGSARRVFERLGADPESFKTAVADQHAAAMRAIRPDIDDVETGARPLTAPPQFRRVMRMTPSAREVFPEVVRIAKQEKAQLSGAYVLMVAAQSERSITAEALATMGLDPVAVVAAARDEITATRW